MKPLDLPLENSVSTGPAYVRLKNRALAPQYHVSLPHSEVSEMIGRASFHTWIAQKLAKTDVSQKKMDDQACLQKSDQHY